MRILLGVLIGLMLAGFVTAHTPAGIQHQHQADPSVPGAVVATSFVSTGSMPVLNLAPGGDLDSCVGQQFSLWWDTTDGQLEFCTLGTGVPAVVTITGP